MIKNSKTVITCAVTGAGNTVQKSDKVPVTPKQIAAACLEAHRAGAAVVHAHVRDLKTAVQLGSKFSPQSLYVCRQSLLDFLAHNPGLTELRGLGFDGFILPAIAQSRKRQPRQLLDDIVSDIPAVMEDWQGLRFCPGRRPS